MVTIELTGRAFGRWTVVRRVENTAQGQARWLCRCACGTERAVKSILLRREHQPSQSCGCLKLEGLIARSTKHGHSPASVVSPTYNTWAGMVARCMNPNHVSFAGYGGRGITVCERWMTFAGFLADMGEKPPGTSIDRKDSNGNYEPGNCRWATDKRQARNKRSNRLLTFNGETKTLAEWAEQLGLNDSTVWDRLDHGWSVDDALSTPAGTTDDNSHSRRLTYRGETKTVSEWSRVLGVPRDRIYMRLHRGWTDEAALTQD